MGKHDKLAEKFFRDRTSSNFKFGPTKNMLKYFGCEHIKGTRGSGNKFTHPALNYPVSIHAHNDGDTLKPYEVEMIKNVLLDLGVNYE